ncbi:type II secretion system protein N [Zoogloea sp. LCSB751]|uniref:type II secretion system protein N n=1 Tax=Zoogloea sp. LCSB751 TaxID=1965277 RepID=UPI0009A4AE5D|nr:type II secretion system protein N [Zoogloea sp. LCSB751]
MNLSERFDLSRLSWPRAARFAPPVAWGVALALSAWVAADLFWRFSAPRAPALPVATVADPQAAAQAIASRHLMGQSAGGPAAIAAPVGRYTLQAVVTGSDGRPGWAVIAVDGGAQQGFVEGQEIQPGVRLATVGRDSIELSTGDARQTIKLVERGGAPTVNDAQATQSGAVVPPPAVFQIPTPANGGDTQGSAAPTQTPFPAGFPAQPVSNQ